MPERRFRADGGLRVRISGYLKPLLGFVALLALANCDETLTSSVVPQPRPVAPAPAPNAYVPPSAESQDLARFYQRVERDLVTRGLLRTDGGGPDTPYDADDLAKNFDVIAFVNEHSGSNAAFTSGSSEIKLSRWKSPIRIMTEFGPSVAPQNRVADRQKIENYSERLRRTTGHNIRSVDRDGNFIVFVAGLDDTSYAQSRLRALVPNIPQDRLDLLNTLETPYYCFVFTFANSGDPNTITKAVAYIRAENPDLLRLSCIHEEIAQGIGLPNDSPVARPSIFNDDDEFALLTSHDEKLLTILYDERMKPGISADEARPVVRIIARELMGQQL
jgi:hypothetical protein